MPELSRFFGLLIKMQYRDHAPPHIHVWYGGRSSARMRIRDADLMSGGLPRPQLAAATAWIFEHQDELLDAWERARHNCPLCKIAPLR